MPIITVIDSLDYTTRPLSLQHTTNGGYVTVYTPQGEFLSRHTSVEEATESIVRHASAVEMTEDTAEVVYKIILPEKHVSILLRRANSTYGPGEVDVTPPSAPTAGFLSNLTSNSIRVNWTNAGDNDIDYTRVYKSTVSSSTFFTLVAQVDYPTNSYTDTINPAQQVWYRVSHVDNAGNESAFSSVFTDITAPTTPAAPTVASVASTSVTLTLPATTAFDHASWRVYRSAAGGSTADTLVASGVTGSTYSVTGLSSGTSYAFAVQAVDASGNASATGAAVSQQTAAEGDNAARINAILNGRSPHFAFSMPADPVTTRQETVTTAAGFNAAAAIAGTRIIVNTSFSGDVRIRANDIDVVMSNSATITGNLNIGDNGLVSRIRWTGGNLRGNIWAWRHNDLLIDDFYALTIGEGSEDNHGFGKAVGFDQSSFFRRLAIINSTLEVRKSSTSTGNSWAFFVVQNTSPQTSTLRHEDLLFLNSKTLCTGLHGHRIMSVRRAVYCDSVISPDPTGDGNFSGTGLRIHLGSDYVWFKDSWCRGNMACGIVSTSNEGPHVQNAIFDNFDRYITSASVRYMAADLMDSPSNTGQIINSTLYTTQGAGDGTIPTPAGGVTVGANCNRAAWDGTTLPDYSTVGAIR